MPSFSVNGRRTSGGRSCGVSGAQIVGRRQARHVVALLLRQQLDRRIVRELADLAPAAAACAAAPPGRRAARRRSSGCCRSGAAGRRRARGSRRGSASTWSMRSASTTVGLCQRPSSWFRLSSICLRSGSRAMSARSLRKSYSNGARAKCWNPNSAATVNAALAISSVRGRAAISARDRPQRQRHRRSPCAGAPPAHTVSHAGSSVNVASQQARLPTAAMTPNCEKPRKLVVAERQVRRRRRQRRGQRRPRGGRDRRRQRSDRDCARAAIAALGARRGSRDSATAG